MLRMRTRNPLRFLALRLLIGFCILASIAACQSVPITGRRQLSLIPEGELVTMSFSAYDDFLSKHKVIRGTKEAEMVKRTGANIQRAVEEYLAQNNLSERIAGYKWEFNLIEDPSANAWAMPGGKVAVYTGILPIARDEKGLAVVMGHEVAHAIARHGNERMSQGLLAQLGGVALSAALANHPAQTQEIFMAAYGLGAQVGVLLPHSRLQESEADHLGLIFMAMAGYDPRAAVGFWERMAGEKKGKSPPEFLSTHPADQTRIDNIKRLLPDAMQYYKG